MIPFDITFVNEDGLPTMNVPDAPQTFTLTLVNRTRHTIRTAALGRRAATHAHITIRFRPNVLVGPSTIRVAEESQAAWVLAVTKDADVDVLELRARTRQTVESGGALTVRLDGLTPNPAGGSRPSRIAVGFEYFNHSRPAVSLSDVRLLHLAISRASTVSGELARNIRTGSLAVTGPFTAGFLGGNEALNDGSTPNLLRLRVVNTSGGPIRLSNDDDAASRLIVTYRVAGPSTPWGLVKRHGDHLSVNIVPPSDPDAPAPDPDVDESGDELGRRAGSGWENDGLVFRRVGPASWAAGEGIEFKIELHTSAAIGETQLIVRYEDLPDLADADLVLLAKLGPVAVSDSAVQVVQPLAVAATAVFEQDVTVQGPLTAANATTLYDTVDVRGSLTARDAVFAGDVDVSGEIDGRKPVRFSDTVQVGELTSTGTARFENGVTVRAGLHQLPASFTVGGRADRWYPVVFDDTGWADGALRLEIFRSRTHTEGTFDWHGSLMAFVECHGSWYGHGADFWSVRVVQSYGQVTTSPQDPFIAGFASDVYTMRHVIWLRGDTMYHWLANHSSGPDLALLDTTIATGRLELARPRTPNNPQQFPVRDSIDPLFRGKYYTVEKYLEHAARRTGTSEP